MLNLTNQVFSHSWGYDMTIVDYVKVIADTPKKAKCITLKTIVKDDYGKGDGRANPGEEVLTESPFYLVVKTDKNGGVYLKGSYPFCNGSKRMGVFFPSKGGEYYNSWD